MLGLFERGSPLSSTIGSVTELFQTSPAQQNRHQNIFQNYRTTTKAFLVVKQCGLIKSYQHFKWCYWCHDQGPVAQEQLLLPLCYWTLMTKCWQVFTKTWIFRNNNVRTSTNVCTECDSWHCELVSCAHLQVIFVTNNTLTQKVNIHIIMCYRRLIIYAIFILW